MWFTKSDLSRKKGNLQSITEIMPEMCFHIPTYRAFIQFAHECSKNKLLCPEGGRKAKLLFLKHSRRKPLQKEDSPFSVPTPLYQCAFGGWLRGGCSRDRLIPDATPSWGEALDCPSWQDEKDTAELPLKIWPSLHMFVTLQ